MQIINTSLFPQDLTQNLFRLQNLINDNNDMHKQEWCTIILMHSS